MGLDCSHDAWSGAYSAFNRFRNKVAEAAGYDVAKVVYDNSNMNHRVPLIDWGHIQKENYLGEWEETPDDPLIVLFVHSDCEGKIYPEQAEPLAERLEEIKGELPVDGEGHIPDYQRAVQKFIDGLRKATDENEPIDFH